MPITIQAPIGDQVKRRTPTCCHAVVFLHGVKSEGDWFAPLADYLTGKAGQGLKGKLPPCQRVFGFRWSELDSGGVSFFEALQDKGGAHTRRAGQEVASILSQLREVIGADGKLSVVAHSQGTVVTARAILEAQAKGKLDSAVLLGSPILRQQDHDLVDAFRSVPYVVNCSSINDKAVLGRALANAANLLSIDKFTEDGPIGGAGVDKGAVREKAKRGEEWIPEPPAAPTFRDHLGIVDIQVPDFGHGDWHEPQHLGRKPKVAQTLLHAVAGATHKPGCHRFVPKEPIMRLKKSAEKLHELYGHRFYEFTPGIDHIV